MFSSGFLGTTAPFYLDMITIYFAILPFLMFASISFVIKKRYNAHFISQLALFAVTLVVVVIFEVGVRISGGIVEFMKTANIPYWFMITFLIVHVTIALVSVVLWSALLYGAVRSYILEAKGVSKSHGKVGRFVFLGMTISSFMGVAIYYMLFIY
jgi:putative membrane protein